jgi:MerR family copper efflux transcriptional regulator
MNIGEVAQLSEVNSKMIRRYEEQGIIPKAGRSLAGYREYSEKDVHILKFVKRSRELGFSMKDIKQLVSLWKNKSRPSAQVKSIALKHQSELNKKLVEIQQILKTLDDLVKNCHGDDRPDCPILDGLNCVSVLKK